MWQRPMVEFVFADLVGAFTEHMVGEELAEEVKHLKRPNRITKHLPKALKAWVRINKMVGGYKPNDVWDKRFHYEGTFMNGYKKLMRVKQNETDVNFRSHDKTQAKDLGKIIES